MKNDIDCYTPIQKLIDHAASVIGLRICYHDRMGNSGLAWQYRRHLHPACSKAREGKAAMRCVEYDAHEVHQEVKNQPEGRIHVCPYGLTEIAVPVFVSSLFAGVLFAGPCWNNSFTPCPYVALIYVSENKWLEERRTMLCAVASQMGWMIQRNDNMKLPESSRKQTVIEYLRKNMHKQITVNQLAAELSLSPSRTSHVVNQLFNMSLPNLINSMRLQQASYWLLTTELTIGEISTHFGYYDQNYFTRIFTKKFNMSPSAYRKKYPFEV